MADQFKLKDQDEIKSLAKELKKPESAAYLDEMRQLAESPEYQRTTPPETQQTLKDAIARAEGMYQSKATTNEWLEVAQTLGRAVAQFGAAQQGMSTGRDMSNLNMGPSIDYGARTDRAFREYQGQLKSAGDLADRDRTSYLDTEAAKKDNFGKREDYLKSALKNAQEIEGDDARFKRQAALDAQKDKRDNARVDNTQLKMEMAELNRQESTLAKQLEAAKSLANTIQTDPDLNKKSRERINEKYGAIAAKAGIDPEVLADIGEQSKDKGVLGTGFFRGEDKTKKSQMINEKVVAPIKTMLDSIQARKAELLGRQSQPSMGNSPSAPSSPAPTPPGPSSGKIRVRQKATGQTGTINPQDFDPSKYEKI